MERAILNPATSEPGGGVELWASRGLNLAWLPCADNWHNPCLLNASLLEAVRVWNPVAPKSDRPVWFWRVEPTFAAWVVRAIRRASERQIALPEAYYNALLTIQATLEAWDPGIWAEVQRKSAEPDVRLPCAEFIQGLVYPAKYGLCPVWDGWEKDEAKAEEAAAAATVAETEAEVGSGSPQPEVSSARGSARGRRSGLASRPALF